MYVCLQRVDAAPRPMPHAVLSAAPEPLLCNIQLERDISMLLTYSGVGRAAARLYRSAVCSPLPALDRSLLGALSIDFWIERMEI